MFIIWFIFKNNIKLYYSLRTYVYWLGEYYTLYPARSRVGREKLVLRHSIPKVGTFRRNLETLRIEWRNSTPRFTSPSRKGKNRNVICLTSSNGNRTHNLLCLQSHACAPVIATLLWQGQGENLIVNVLFYSAFRLFRDIACQFAKL